jgi:serine/threonine protein kinase
MVSSVGRFGKYTLVRRIAQGGMGEVWLARQQGPGGFAKNVAVKMLLPHLTEDKAFVDALLAEAAVTARLTHRNIAQVFDFGLDDETGSYFLTMEFVAGRPLHRLLHECARRGERLDPAVARDLAVQLCDGLSYAHNLRGDDGAPLHLVHRDLNPANVLVSYNGDVKIIDWGIAKSEISAVRTETGTIKGKFVYMSPEQSSARPVDRRSDIFALGITLYELLTGTNPFQRPNVLLSLEAIQKDDPPPPGGRDPLLAPFDDILRRALEKNPDDRYADAAEMAEALRDLALPAARERLGSFVLRLFPDQSELERPEPSDMRRRMGSGPHNFAPDATERASISVQTQASSSLQEQTVAGSATRHLATEPQSVRALRWPLTAAAMLALAAAGGGWWWSHRAVTAPPPRLDSPATVEPPVGGPAPAPPVSPPAAQPPVTAMPEAVKEAPSTIDPARVPPKLPAPKEPPNKVSREPSARTDPSPAVPKVQPPLPVVEVTAQPPSGQGTSTMTVSTQERGRISLRTSPGLAMVVDGRPASPGAMVPLMRESGTIEVGEAGDPLRVHVRYRLLDDDVEATIDSTPWSIVEADGDRAKTPRRLRLAGAATILDLSNPTVEQHLRLTLRYQPSPSPSR